MSCGYLYIAIGKRYILEAETSARSLKRFTKLPLCLITEDESYKNELFDIVINESIPGDFVAKIIGMQRSPFSQTIFLDSDTFVCSSIDHLFSVLELFDMSMTVDNFMHGTGFFEKYNPKFMIKYKSIIPEYNTGIIIFKKNGNVKRLLQDWYDLHNEMHIKADMPSFREAYLKNVMVVRISPLPFEYNYHGTNSFGFVYNEIKIIHERYGERWNTLTQIALPYEKMLKKAKQFNKYTCKRLIIPYFGVIPYSYSPYNIKKKIKKLFGVKKTKKSETF